MSSLSYWRSTLLLVFVASLAVVVRSAPAVARVAREAEDDKSDVDKLGPKDAVAVKKEEDSPFDLFEGDIMLSDLQKAALTDYNEPTESVTESVAAREKRSLISVTQSPPGKAAIHHTWTHGVVPFERSTTLGVRFRKMFDMAIKIIENKTCIRFVERTNEANYLFFDNDNDCKSHVGCTGGLQKVSLSLNCASVGTALHELCHALGLWHEHSRVDRDRYIDIITENFKYPQLEVNFKKVTQEVFKSVPDVGYDIQSVMHYNPYAFSRDSRGNDGQTIRVRQDADLEELNCTNRLPMGQREQLSYKDQLRLNELYQCTDIVVEQPECEMPTPTPTTMAESETETTVIPTPTSTIPTLPQDKRLRSGNTISLTLREESEGRTVLDAHGMECLPSPGCTPIPCTGSSCYNDLENRFKILRTVDQEDNKDDSIRNGDTVVLRSLNDYSYYLDCSDPTNCIVSTCWPVDDPNNASTISDCSKHQFQIYGINRNPRKVLNTKHKLQFKSNHPHPDPKQTAFDHYLSCNQKYCHLKRKGECPPENTKIIFSPRRDRSGDCLVDNFKANKLT